ncbi:MAG: chorismate-binding protein [Deltaproteobacteria bacterium]|nr:chorismate-binding protein [Deltaproteobacteria bacterium]
MKVMHVNKLIDTINHLINSDHPFAVFFYPGEKEPELVLQQKKRVHKLMSLSDLNNQKGFVFAPFYISGDYPLVMIEPDIHVKGYQAITGLPNMISSGKLSSAGKTKGEHCDVSKADYIKLLNKSIDEIKAGEFEKVIISRTISANIPGETTTGDLFIKLKEKLDRAFVYLVSLPGTGTWLGGTPELLLTKTNGAYRTVSLAGTVPLNGAGHEIEWSAEMKMEQQIVTDFIADNLRSFQIENCSQTGPVTEFAGNVAHLKTIFEFSGNKIEEQLIPFIKAIHPGPAICGFPKEAAREYVLENESHRREYYCGFLGNWKMGDELRLFVNIRCMKILADRAVIYVGGGITSGSTPESEWDETEHKAKSLLSVIGKN